MQSYGHMSKYIIYGLVDPITNEIRYVGKSCKGLERPKEHMWPFSLKNKSKKNSWIKKLMAVGLKPSIVVIETCGLQESLDEREIYWISFYRKINKNLTNMTDGGTGGNTGQAFKKWKPVLSMNVVTGDIKRYEYVWQTESDGFSPTKVVCVCKGKRHTHRGHVFWYEGLAPRPIVKKTIVPIEVTNKLTLEKVSFKSIKEAAQFLDIDRSHISNCLSGKMNHRKYFFSRA